VGEPSFLGTQRCQLPIVSCEIRSDNINWLWCIVIACKLGRLVLLLIGARHDDGNRSVMKANASSGGANPPLVLSANQSVQVRT
jgi:hypothetical protein